jgi:hypothetical protein
MCSSHQYKNQQFTPVQFLNVSVHGNMNMSMLFFISIVFVHTVVYICALSTKESGLVEIRSSVLGNRTESHLHLSHVDWPAAGWYSCQSATCPPLRHTAR